MRKNKGDLPVPFFIASIVGCLARCVAILPAPPIGDNKLAILRNITFLAHIGADRPECVELATGPDVNVFLVFR